MSNTPSSTPTLLVPIHVDALCLESDRLVVEAMAHFSRLPYMDRAEKCEVNADTANISESIVSQPFQSQNLNLKAGVHLHWALPDALTQGRQAPIKQGQNQENENTEGELIQTMFPSVPNRWLITRSGLGQEKCWIVESDYIYPSKSALEADKVGGVNYYYRNKQHDDNDAPFRLIGRQVPLELWLQEIAQGGRNQNRYLDKEHCLTAIGYGELTFAAFYPNSHSVFGFYDDEIFTNFSNYSYEVIGWYSSQAEEPQNQIPNTLESNSGKTIDKIAAYLKDNFSWHLGDTSSQAIPKCTLFYGAISFSPTVNEVGSQPDTDSTVTIAIGNTTIEALSTYLAHQIAKEDLKIINPNHPSCRDRLSALEDQLEALFLFQRLSSQNLDIASRLHEFRHQTSFTPIPAGIEWLVRIEAASDGVPITVTQTTDSRNGEASQNGNSSQPADANQAQTQRRLVLPSGINNPLKKFNQLQQRYDKAQRNIETQRKQLFSDWYKYMLCTYHPPEDNRYDEYPDVDEVQFFIEAKDIKPLQRDIKALSKIQSQLKTQKTKLNSLIADYNSSCIAYIAPTLENSVGNSRKPSIKFSDRFTIPEDSITNNLIADESDHVGSLSSETSDHPELALQFDGDTNYFSIKVPRKVSSAAWTLSAWIYSEPIAQKTHCTLFTIGQLQLQLHPYASDRLVMVCPDTDSYVKVLSTNQWHHVALTYEVVSHHERPKLTLYVNGETFPVPLLTEYRLEQADRICVGASMSSSGANTSVQNLFKGKMAHIRIDNRALVAAEIGHDMNNSTRPVYRLQSVPAPHYWQSNEPVILLVGEGIRATDRHGQDGRYNEDDTLDCPVINAPDTLFQLIQPTDSQKFLTIANINDALRSFREIAQEQLKNTPIQAIALRQETEHPWNPLFLEWEIQLQPVQAGTNVASSGFSADMITDNYQLSDNAIELGVKPNRQSLAGGALYSNSCILSSHAALQFEKQIAEFLQQAIFDRPSNPSNQKQDDYHTKLKEWYDKIPYGRVQMGRDALQKLKEWYVGKPSYSSGQNFSTLLLEEQANDPVYIAICAGLKLYDRDGGLICFLSQTLDGFNEELLMHKKTLQLPVEDPLTFEDKDKYASFTQAVADLVAGNLYTAPEPANQFNPIRSGAMTITRLRLVDTFGQVKDFNTEEILKAGKEILTPQQLTVSGSPHLVWLPPRFVQPARVDFHWLSAQEDNPETAPICGWLLPNNLDKSLGVYDDSCKMLGSIVQRRSRLQWEPAPGRNRQVDEITNPHLKRLVEHILAKGDAKTDRTATDENFLEDFLTTIDIALETIDPENFAQHQSLALLMGRPIALVRAWMNLELQGIPAVHQGWHAFSVDLRRSVRETDEFTRVRFPIRVGQYQQLNDGVVGYWKESHDGSYEHNKFFAPQTLNNKFNRSIDHPDIVIHGKRWIEKQKITDALGTSPETREQIWKELLQHNWLKSLGEDLNVAEVKPKPRAPLPPDSSGRFQRQIQQLLDEVSINPLNILQSIDSPPQVLTMLIDPRGLVHLTSGVLPTAAIALPPEDYTAALEALQVTFLTSPVLTEQGTRSLALPEEVGFSWHWMEHKRWLEKAIFTEILEAQDGQEALAPNEINKLWQQLIDRGWINDKQPARIIPMGRRQEEQLEISSNENSAELISQLEDRIEQLFWTDFSKLPILERETFLGKLRWKITPSAKLSRLLRNNLLNQLRLQINPLPELSHQLWDDLPYKQIRWLSHRDTFFRNLKWPPPPAKLSRLLWDYLLETQVRWLSPIPGDPIRAEVVSKDERAAEVLQEQKLLLEEKYAALRAFWFSDLQSQVEQIFASEALEISPINPQATFSPVQEIREGWLVLRKEENS